MNSQKNDILAPVRQKLLDENQQLLVKPPQDLEANFVKLGGQAEKARLAGAGAKLLFVAAVPTAVVAGILEYLGGTRVGGK